MTPLDAVWEWYEYARDSIGLAAHQVECDPYGIPRSLIFAAAVDEPPLEGLSRAQAELDDLTVLALFAVFEQAVLERLLRASASVKGRATTGLEAALSARAFRGLDRWPLEGVLDVCKAAVDAAVVGLVKQVKGYRDWVAHGKRGAPDARIDPRAAYDRLSDFLAALEA